VSHRILVGKVAVGVTEPALKIFLRIISRPKNRLKGNKKPNFLPRTAATVFLAIELYMDEICIGLPVE
jgi:hypothetical protein